MNPNTHSPDTTQQIAPPRVVPSPQVCQLIAKTLPWGWKHYAMEVGGAVDAVTIITTTDGSPANKVVELQPDGTWTKTAAANRAHYYGETVAVPDTFTMQRVLEGLRPDQCLVLGVFPYLAAGYPVNVVSQAELSKKLGLVNGSADHLNGIFECPERKHWLCRVANNMAPSTWRLVDFDAKPDMPSEWHQWRPENLRAVLGQAMPELANAAMVTLPSTGNRIVDANGHRVLESKGSYHAYIQTEHGVYDGWQAALRVRVVNLGYHFTAKISRGHRVDPPFDQSAMQSTNRLSFEGSPALGPVAAATGARVGPATIRVVPGERVRVGQVPPLTREESKRYQEITRAIVDDFGDSWSPASGGGDRRRSGDGSSADFIMPDSVRLDEEFETEHGMGTLREFLESGARKWRIQAPWRNSTSWNGYFGLHDSGIPFAFDNGDRTKYMLHGGDEFVLRGGLEDVPADPPPEPPLEQTDPSRAAVEAIPAGIRERIAANVDLGAVGEEQWTALRQELKEETGRKLGDLDRWRKLLKKAVREAERARKVEAKQKRQEAQAQAEEAAQATWDLARSARYQFAQELKQNGNPWTGEQLITKVNAPAEEEGGPALEDVLPMVSNVRAILTAGCGRVYPMFYRNGLSGQLEFSRPRFRGYQQCTWDPVTEAKDEIFDEMHADTVQDFSTQFSRESIIHQIELLASKSTYHPVLDYLRGLVWDGVPRLDTWLPWATGCPDTQYHRDVGRLMLLGAVKRVLEPGCKYDYMPVLMGPQGILKSTFLGVIAVRDQWFADVKLDHRDLNRTCQEMHGVWFAEIGELAGLGKAGIADVKQFITRRVDRYRRAYARIERNEPRQFVMVGTVNGTEFLRDTTGNRRFLPVICGDLGLQWAHENIGQLYAEAFLRVQCGELPMLSAEGEETARELQEEHRQRLPFEDDWREALEWLIERKENPQPVSSGELIGPDLEAVQALEIGGYSGRYEIPSKFLTNFLWCRCGLSDKSRRTGAVQQAMYEVLRMNGWEKKLKMMKNSHGKRVSVNFWTREV